ncbi:hypothetical protein BDV95DRAFT_535348 [Massariosphaeria phaeospora]|uniref:DRBM domain-containing protein n=1 Tax=Massariosphaeria phaeospora TaxID=100035 RepID=A0A7C8IEH7_9PLEO|nr:hypothetical protein BDV95DRAFT_535348 [Massariosphaeria phaeospora]
MAAQTAPWSTRLREHCQVRQLGEPSWQDISDRRGGRTAWSSVVALPGGTTYPARFWYDGAYMEQAREDAAEMALRHLTGTLNTAVEPPPASFYVRGSQ